MYKEDIHISMYKHNRNDHKKQFIIFPFNIMSIFGGGDWLISLSIE